MQNDIEKTMRTCRNMFVDIKNLSINRIYLYDFLLIMLETMLRVHCHSEMKILIEYMETLFTQKDINQWLGIQKMKIKYYDMISDNEKRNEHYKQYICAYERVEAQNQKTKINGARAQIEVDNIMKVAAIKLTKFPLIIEYIPFQISKT